MLGKGSFGHIYAGIHMDTGQEVAIKVEPLVTQYPQVRWEAKVYAAQKGIKPEIHWFGVADNYTVLVMEKLDGSLMAKRLPMSLNSIARQMLDRIRGLHVSGYIHRDIKPENFMFRGRRVFLIDMGLAKRYQTETGAHIPFQTGKRMVGTPRYASINNQDGCEVSRRDDLESIAYVLIYLALGKLPWQSLPKCSNPHAKILQKKKKVSENALCAGLPVCFYNFLTYAKSLKFDETPDYDRCIFWFCR